jgi:hypothetical protein
MAAATDTNEITIDPARCIYVKNGNNSEIYFSNYYLKQVIANMESSFVLTNSYKFNFENTDFMNHTLIDPTNQDGIPDIRSAINALSNVITPPTLNPTTLDLSLYSKLTYTPNSTPTLSTLNLETNITEIIIEGIKDKNDSPIFDSKAQIRQFLKYNGKWITGSIVNQTFNEKTKITIEDEKVTMGGGKKTTTRRRDKTGYNKHRKSNRRR